MVDVGDKDETERRARAEARVHMAAETLAVIRRGVPKGDVSPSPVWPASWPPSVRHELIPLCHPLSLSFVDVQIEADRSLPGLRVSSEARLSGRTGVEMEALVAASVAALTVYDMCKAVDRGMEVGAVRLLEKSGGRSGTWRREGRSERGRPDQGAATVVSVNVAAEKGVRKQPREAITLVVEHGVEGDAHAGAWHRQVSLLAVESIAAHARQGPGRASGRLRRERDHRGHGRARAARRRPAAPGRDRWSRSPRSARSATTAARSSTRPATA